MPNYLEIETLDVSTTSLRDYWPNWVHLLAEEQAVWDLARYHVVESLLRIKKGRILAVLYPSTMHWSIGLEHVLVHPLCCKAVWTTQHLQYGRISKYVLSINFYSFWLFYQHNNFGKNKKITKINGCNTFIEWTDPDSCWLIWNININWQEKETQDANQRDFRILDWDRYVPWGPSPWKHNDDDDIIQCSGWLNYYSF